MVLTRSEVIDVRRLVTVAEVTTVVRGLSVEVEFDHHEAGLDRPSVINCDGLHTVDKTTLVRRLGSIDSPTRDAVCGAVRQSLGC